VADNAYGSWDDRVETLSFTPPGLEDCGFCSGNTVSFAPTLVNNAFNGHKAMRFGFGDYNIYNVTGLTGLVAPNGSQTVFPQPSNVSRRDCFCRVSPHGPHHGDR
jgi:hypothetical protein